MKAEGEAGCRSALDFSMSLFFVKFALMKKLAILSFIASLFFGACSFSAATGSEKSSSQAAKKKVSYDKALDYAKVPAGTPEQIVEYEGFRVSFNKDNRTANWVAWELLGSETNGMEKRSDDFWCDTSVEGCPDIPDYKKSGFDRGHLCPAADQKWSPVAMHDCFSFANMAPQDHSLNSGAWQTLEKKERLWAQRDSAIVIIAGPIYQPSDKNYIGSGVRVPSAFYKVIIAPYLDEPRGIGFIYPNMSSPGNMKDYSMTIDEVEKITGIDFFPNLPDEIENKIESVASFNEWDRR